MLMSPRVPVLYKISTLVDAIAFTSSLFCSRSLQNFYSCRFRRSRHAPRVPVLYKISTLVDYAEELAKKKVPVLYKISTLVDSITKMTRSVFPFFTKFLLL